MFSNNKILAWLEKKDAKSQKLVLKEASRDVKKVKAEFQKGHEEFKEEGKPRCRILLKNKKSIKQGNCSSWSPTLVISLMLDSGSPHKKWILGWLLTIPMLPKSLLSKAQIRFRQFVLQQVTSDKNLFVFIKGKRVPLSWQELAENCQRAGPTCNAYRKGEGERYVYTCAARAEGAA